MSVNKKAKTKDVFVHNTFHNEAYSGQNTEEEKTTSLSHQAQKRETQCHYSSSTEGAYAFAVDVEERGTDNSTWKDLRSCKIDTNCNSGDHSKYAHTFQADETKKSSFNKNTNDTYSNREEDANLSRKHETEAAANVYDHFKKPRIQGQNYTKMGISGSSENMYDTTSSKTKQTSTDNQDTYSHINKSEYDYTSGPDMYSMEKHGGNDDYTHLTLR